MLLFLELPVLIILSIGLYLALINRCAAIVNDKGHGSLFYTMAISVLWFGGELIGFFIGFMFIFMALSQDGRHQNITDAIGMLLCGLPISVFVFGGLSVLPVFVIAWIMPPEEKIRRRLAESEPRLRGRIKGDHSGSTVMVVVLIAVLCVSCILVTVLTFAGAWVYTRQTAIDPPPKIAGAPPKVV